jgi:hypothetical protein
VESCYKRESRPRLLRGLTAVVACLLALITIGSPVAFNDLVSMSVSGLYLSYFIETPGDSRDSQHLQLTKRWSCIDDLIREG